MFGSVHMKRYQEVYFETPNKLTGVMRRQVASYIEPHELKAFVARIEKQGGRVIRIHEPREVETSEV
jgi:hypothetical protein